MFKQFQYIAWPIATPVISEDDIAENPLLSDLKQLIIASYAGRALLFPIKMKKRRNCFIPLFLLQIYS